MGSKWLLLEGISNFIVDLEKKLAESRVKWASLGDCSTQFFHLTTVKKRKVNKIEHLELSNGSWTSSPLNIHNEDLDFYK